MSRHFLIPDTQIRPGVATDHIDWIAQAIVEYRPDCVVHIGDHWDMPSLSMHDGVGSMKMEGARYEDDIESGNEAFARLTIPMETERARLKRNKEKQWNPRKVFCFGNHENRINRAVNSAPKWAGTIGEHHMRTLDWERRPFLDRVWQDGVLYSHFFQSSHSSHAIGGSIDNRLNKIGTSFVQGHEQGFRYGTRIQASGATWHGLVAGSAYLHDEDYRGNQGQGHWRGVVVLNEVRDGDYCVMPLTLDYLCRKYEGISLGEFLRKKYKDAEYKYTLARAA
ncbi:hypothetical protein [Noviluteimonas gilva]|uniref:hypothetical protein n=1 Tax=Noviluteimonas gilva TaxID=2682097 RepID=UPI0018D22B82|nr:hypothetical protein [Lysobacter gilvus]